MEKDEKGLGCTIVQGKGCGIFRDLDSPYKTVNQRQWKIGITTGTCAAAAAQAAAVHLLTGVRQTEIPVHTPKGITAYVPVQCFAEEAEKCEYMAVKNSGDDPDVTNGAEVYVSVERRSEEWMPDVTAFTDSRYPGLWLEGGQGVGRVTKAGLEQGIGYAAINKVPRAMIFEAVGGVRESAGYEGKLLILVRIPAGEKLAEKTFNPMLGIEGGISILGTSGILEPMSEKAIVDTIEAQIKQLRAQGETRLLVTPGNYGQGYVSAYLGLDLSKSIKCSNYIGDTLDLATAYGMEEFLLVGNMGKLIKLAAGIMNTHSKVADGRREIMVTHTVLQGGSLTMAEVLMSCVTTEEMLGYLEEWGLREAVVAGICEKIHFHIARRAGSGLRAGVMLFSEKYGFLGETAGCGQMLEGFRVNTEQMP
ncbi:MAG: cobalt-precorrin-5B (C(1))-methyltransferase CbiD [Roseburia sp.]|nr:cobalt-precorrin-5B (C(1))-methyltransferase CbiD [Roseburia sp.]